MMPLITEPTLPVFLSVLRHRTAADRNQDLCVTCGWFAIFRWAKGWGLPRLCLWALFCLASNTTVLADGLPEPPALGAFELTLEGAIGLALERNRSFLNRRLDREVQSFSLDVAEDRWSPRITVNPFASEDRQDRNLGIEAGASLRVPTGGELALRWEESLSEQSENSGSQSLSFSQPLLKGAWAEIDSAAVERARLEENINILAYREAAADLVVSVIGSYRALIGAARQVEIGEASLRRAREQLEATRALIRAGRVAQREAVRAEAAVANRELSLVRAQNHLDAANFGLVDILELDSTVWIRPLEELSVERTEVAFESAFEEALRRSTEFLQARLRVDSTRIGLAVAGNNLLPDLSLGVELNRDEAGRTNTSVRIGATIPLNDRSPELEHLRAHNELRKAERSLVELRESIGIAVRQAVNDVEVGLQLTELARGARELAQEHLAIERNKFGQGLSSTFEVASSEDELVRAEQAEADAIIAYLNALARLDRVSGRTLERWGIRLEAITE